MTHQRLFPSPGWCISVDGVGAVNQRVTDLTPSQGTYRSPVRGCVSGNHIWWFSPSLSPFLPPFSWESVSQSMGWATGVRDTWKRISRSWKQEICVFNKHPQWVWGTLQLELGPKNEMVFHPHCLSFSEHLLLIRSWGFLSKLTINTLVWCIAPPCPEARQPW